MTALSIALLLAVLVLCTVALYSNAYRDNWPQCVGLVLLATWCAAEMAAVVQGHLVEPRDMTMYLALTAFALGTALKVRHHRPAKRDTGASTQAGEVV